MVDDLWDEWMERYLTPPEEDHLIGRCKECESEVWIDTSLREAGMAESCEEHEPLCQLQEGGCSAR